MKFVFVAMAGASQKQCLVASSTPFQTYHTCSHKVNGKGAGSIVAPRRVFFFFLAIFADSRYTLGQLH
jgi:hypothetical protein